MLRTELILPWQPLPGPTCWASVPSPSCFECSLTKTNKISLLLGNLPWAIGAAISLWKLVGTDIANDQLIYVEKPGPLTSVNGNSVEYVMGAIVKGGFLALSRIQANAGLPWGQILPLPSIAWNTGPWIGVWVHEELSRSPLASANSSLLCGNHSASESFP